MSQRKINILIVLLISLLFFVVFSDRIVHVNGPSTAAVIFRPFNGGLDQKHVYGEGVFYIWPWNTFYQFDTKEQMVEKELHIVVQNGVSITLHLNFRYKPDRKNLPYIFRTFGVHYADVFVVPEVVASCRQLISDFTPDAIYSLQLDSIRKKAFEISAIRVAHGRVVLTELNIMDIELPVKVVEAIEMKLQNEQMSLGWDYKMEIAEKERLIKIIEARGTMEATKLINKGLTDKYLQFKQIEAFDKLSNSANSKTIIIPRGTSTPLILNQNQ